MAEEEYEDAFDFKKIGVIAVVIIIAVVAATVFLGIIEVNIPTIPDIELPEVNINIETEQPSQQQEPDTVVTDPPPTPVSPIINAEDKRGLIKPEYEKFIEFGITIDDIVDIQNMSCLSFDEGNISTDPKYAEIFEQRRTEC